MIPFSHRVASIALASLFAATLIGRAATPEKDTGKARAMYACDGFAEPIRSGMRVAKGRVLPLRAKLVKPDGGFADGTTLKTAPQVRVHFVPDSGAETDVTGQIDVRDYGKGTSFVWDPEAHWKIDVGTLKFEKPGAYRAFLISGDEAEYEVKPGCEVTFQLAGERGEK